LCTFEAGQREGSKLTPRAANPWISADPILHGELPLLKNHNNAMGDFKNIKKCWLTLVWT
jgi:hypothetical protein